MSMTFNGLNGLTFGDGTSQNTAASGFGFKNRIINGDMRIDQRNFGASGTVSSSQAYTVDRWVAQNYTDGTMTYQRVTDAPVGFTHSLKFTTTATDTSLAAGQYAFTLQKIEGYNVADLAFGTSAAKTLTASFWVKSSLTGSFSGVLVNLNFDRSYAYSYTINAANTWEYKTVVIPGCTTGTWQTDNNGSFQFLFGLGCGSTYTGSAGSWVSTGLLAATGQVNVLATSGATWQITGVQLENSPTATAFDYHAIGLDLYLCKRYFQRSPSEGRPVGSMNGSTTGLYGFVWEVEMRSAPSIQFYGGGTAGGNFNVYLNGGATSVTGDIGNSISSKGMRTNFSAGSGYGSGATWIDYGTSAGQMGWTASAEL